MACKTLYCHMKIQRKSHFPPISHLRELYASLHVERISRALISVIDLLRESEQCQGEASVEGVRVHVGHTGVKFGVSNMPSHVNNRSIYIVNLAVWG